MTGLQARAELNGAAGHVVGTAGGRINVVLADGKAISVRRENLDPLPQASSAGTAEPGASLQDVLRVEYGITGEAAETLVRMTEQRRAALVGRGK